jgi:dihydrofolate reductase
LPKLNHFYNLKLDMNTSQAKLSLIVAASMTTRIIGNPDGELPWPLLKEDFKHFKKTTLGHPVIMGRVTWEEIRERREGKPLPDRTNIVVTGQRGYEVPDGVFTAYSVAEALAIAKRAEEETKRENQEIFVIGGTQLYEATIEMANIIYMTVVNIWLTEGPKFPKFPDWFSKQSHRLIPKEGDTPEYFIEKWVRSDL